MRNCFYCFFLIFIFFGLPSFERYMDGKTIFTEHQEFYDNQDVPAISIRATKCFELSVNNLEMQRRNANDKV